MLTAVGEVHRVRLLGPLAVDEQEVPGARLRALLVPLLLAHGRTVPAGDLCEEVWGLDLPGDPAGALQALVSRARRGTGLPVEAVAGGYRVPAAAVDVDAVRVEDELRGARAALRAGDRAGARAAARRGWELLAGATGVLDAMPTGVAARARAVRRDLLLVRAEVELSGVDDAVSPREGTGDGLADTLADLEQEVAGAPLDEPLAAALLRVLVALGRPAQALARYEEVRRAVDGYGGSPSGALRAAHAEALAASADGPIGSDDRPGGRPAASTASVEAPTAVVDRASPGVRVAGPRVAEALLGRDDDLAALDERVRAHPLVTLVGPGGVGKTTLVSALVARRRAAGEPVHEVPLAGLRAGEDVLPVVLAALGGRRPDATGREGGAGAPEEELRRAAAGASGLLVLDNCEHLLDAVAEVALAVCAGASPGLAVLATSRAPLGVLGEQVHLLHPLGPAAAHDLVRRRAAAVRPDADLPAPAVAQLCRRLDHLPLALELAAARLRTTSLADLLAALEHRVAVLAPGPRGLPERHRSLQALVDWSWELLPEPERVLLARMAVFPAGAGATAVAAVCADDDGPAGDGAGDETAAALPARGVPSALAGLVDASLVVWDATADDGRGRYRLLETVREYADGRRSPRARRAGERRLARWAAGLAADLAADLRGQGQVAALRRAGVERDALAAALRWATAEGETALAAPLGLLLVETAWLRGAHAEGLERLALLAGAPSVLDPGERGRRAAADLTGPELARVWRESAETCAVGIPNAAVGALDVLAAGRPRLLAVLTSRLRRALRRPELLGAGLAATGELLLGVATDPPADHRSALDRAATAPDAWWRGWGLLARAWWLENGGLDDLGLADARAAHAVMDAAGNTAGRAVAGAFVAERLTVSGEAAASVVWWQRAEQDHAGAGAEGDARQTRLSLLRVLADLDGDPEARRSVQAQIALLAAEHPHDDMARFVVLSASVAGARERGDLATARAQMAGAVEDLSRCGLRPIPQLVALVEASAGLLALEDGDAGAARGHLGLAVAAARTSHDVPAQAAVGEAVAHWCAEHDDPVTAGRLLALAARFGARMEHLLGWQPLPGRPVPPGDPDAARAVRELDGPAAVALLRELLDRALQEPGRTG